jgi:hypothetical protein
MLRWIAMLLMMSGAGAHAADDSELPRLNNLLNVINHEQQALVQQVQIIQELRRSNTQMLCGGQLAPGVVDYADWVAAQRSAMQREDALRDQTDQLYARWNELETSKRPVLQRIYELALPKPE